MVTNRGLTRRDRIEGWKSIAGALGQSVRTVQRWHLRGMPVYRNPNTGHVWAYLGELVRWRDDPGLRGGPSPSGGGAL